MAKRIGKKEQDSIHRLLRGRGNPGNYNREAVQREIDIHNMRAGEKPRSKSRARKPRSRRL